MELIEKKIVDYVNEVDSPSPTPGGGSVAALVGVLGVSLSKMLAHFSIEKKKFKEASQVEQNQFILAFKELEYCKDILLKGVDDDAIYYQAINQAIKRKDKEELFNVLNAACAVGIELQEVAYNGLIYSSKLVELGNKYLYSDLISGAILLSACCEMTSLNVSANAKLLEDEHIKEKYLNESDELVKKSKALKCKIIKNINEILNS